MIYMLWALCCLPFIYNFLFPFSYGETLDGKLNRKRLAFYSISVVSIGFIVVLMAV